MKTVNHYFRPDSIDTNPSQEGTQGNHHATFHLSQSALGDSLGSDTIVKGSPSRLTPYQVLSMLPKDATPAQQDSAIQAWFQPSEIHYSEQPDTLHLPGEGIPRDLKTVEIPQYDREGFFKDSMYFTAQNGGRKGVAGDPVPYTLGNDDLITGLLIVCFLLMSFALSRTSGFITRQVKDFFYTQTGDHSITETGTEIRLQLIFLVIASLVLSLIYYSYTITYVSDTFSLVSEYALLGIFFAILLAYFSIKFLLYTMVNNLFFGPTENKKFLTSYLFIYSLETVLLFPATLVLAYFHFETQNVLFYCAAMVFLAKILTFYKAYVIFFRQNRFFLQIILYFCALEMVPLFMILGGLAVVVNELKVIF